MNITPHNIVSLGGVVVGLSLLVWEIVTWWPGTKSATKPKHLLKLLPFALAWLYGMLLILSAGGFLGLAADWSLWGASEIGDAVLEYGAGGTSPEVTRTSNLALTAGGHGFVIVATVGLVAVWFKRRGINWMLVRAVLCGICLGLAGGIAGVAGYVLSPAVSTAGDAIVGLL
ncbi:MULTISPECIES: hypothetical protein [unclassified Streptomyces]|uniref:hypothetical protein n=1 Tax=unclassified Streptomyces TaxID=2593676 RepID=UPI0006AEFF61|nr:MULTISPECIES: hypothetical protein [unclassified Streptomyces]